MLLFIALELDEGPRAALLDAVACLRGELQCRVAWTRPEHLHLTLRYLGDTPMEVVEWIERALDEVRFGPCPFRPTRWGAFPTPSVARAIWAGMEPEQESRIAALAKQVEIRLHSIGIPREPRPFHPHITVGRVKEKPEDLVTAFESVPLSNVGESNPRRVVLMETIHTHSGPVYHVHSAVRIGDPLP